MLVFGGAIALADMESEPLGVICKSCGNAFEIDRYTPTGDIKIVDFPNMAWRQRLTCQNPRCLATNDYKGDDLIVGPSTGA